MRSFGLQVLILAGLALPASAGPVIVHEPSAASVTVAAGSAATVPVRLGIPGTAERTYFVWTLDRHEGTLPRAWLSVSPRTAYLVEGATLSLAVTVSVPADAAPGTYVARLRARAMSGHGQADPGDGLRLEVRVPARCAAVPDLHVEEFGPSLLWPPDHRVDAVIVRGRVSAPPGCTVLEVAYRIEDEYGEFSATGTLALAADGAFSVALPVQVARDGRDRDGRHYWITLQATDEAGTASSAVLEAVVPHDRR